MNTTRVEASPMEHASEELIDTLIAISVVSKRLAVKLRQEQENPSERKEPDHE